MRIASSFFVGLIFGLGLVISQMINPQKIIAFLDVAGNWDPSLLVVMGTALVTTFAGYRFVLAREKPVFEARFQIPEKTVIDRPLLIGAGLFGIGWGLAGLCPGPGITAAAVGGLAPWAYLAAMALGMQARRLVKVWRAFASRAKNPLRQRVIRCSTKKMPPPGGAPISTASLAPQSRRRRTGSLQNKSLKAIGSDGLNPTPAWRRSGFWRSGS